MLFNVGEMGHFRPILQILLSVLFAGFILFSCSDNTDEIVPTEVKVAEQVDPVFFSDEIIPIFEQNCIYCHSEEHTRKHHYPVTPYLTASVAYDELMSGGYVDTISPEKSILYLRVEGTTLGLRMPLSGKLSDFEIQKILGWIKFGAPNN